MVAYDSFKVKDKSSWVIPKVVTVAYGSGRLRELFITKFKSQIKRGWSLTRAVARRASILYCISCMQAFNSRSGVCTSN